MALAAALAPWLTMAAVSVHVLADSHAAGEQDPGRDLGGPLHGHRHEAATPEHEHFVIVPAARSAVCALPAAFADAILSAAPTASRIPAESPVLRWYYDRLGPPPRARAIVILRV